MMSGLLDLLFCHPDTIKTANQSTVKATDIVISISRVSAVKRWVEKSSIYLTNVV